MEFFEVFNAENEMGERDREMEDESLRELRSSKGGERAI